jgi:hypothetical protein
MMNGELEIFDVVKNVEFKEFACLEESGTELSVLTLLEPSADEWNRKARIQNTKMFTLNHEREPVNYSEVLVWIYPDKEKVISLGTI